MCRNHPIDAYTRLTDSDHGKTFMTPSCNLHKHTGEQPHSSHYRSNPQSILRRCILHALSSCCTAYMTGMQGEPACSHLLKHYKLPAFGPMSYMFMHQHVQTARIIAFPAIAAPGRQQLCPPTPISWPRTQARDHTPHSLQPHYTCSLQQMPCTPPPSSTALLSL